MLLLTFAKIIPSPQKKKHASKIIQFFDSSILFDSTYPGIKNPVYF